MIIGHGLIARELFAQGAACAIYHAAGVSNSRCADAGEYARDAARLRQSLSVGMRVVYFSTCSLYGEDNPYTRHKREMEDLVLARDGVVLRVPNVVGRNAPAHQLVPFLLDRICRDEPLVLQRDARRNLVDVADVARLARSLICSTGIVNVAATHDHSLPEIVAALEEATGKRARYGLVDGGVAHKVPDSILQTEPGYMRAVIAAHYGHCVPARAAVA